VLTGKLQFCIVYSSELCDSRRVYRYAVLDDGTELVLEVLAMKKMKLQ